MYRFIITCTEEINSKMNQHSESLIPKLKISNELTLITKNDISTGELSKDQINKLLDLMTSWTELLQKEINLIEDIKCGKIQDGAIAEHTFWNKRFVNFKSLIKQLSTSKAVKKNVSIMEIISNRQIVLYTLGNFKDTELDFKITFDTVVLNTKFFIDSIYPGLKAIINEPIYAVIESITTMYNNLNLMWLTSSFYGRKENMGRLIESISNLIAERISITLAIPTIFEFKPSEALYLIDMCYRLLNYWKTKYTKCKNSIEKLSTRYFSRWAWEFDEDIIFRQLNSTAYIVIYLIKTMKIAERIKFISLKLDFFLNEDVNQPIRFIKERLKIFFELKIDVYKNDKGHQKWNEIMEKFTIDLEYSIEKRMTESVKISKNTYKDFIALKYFITIIQSRQLSQALRVSYNYPLKKFVDDIKYSYRQFKSIESSRTLLINVPPVAGTIILVHDLLLRSKRTARVIKSAIPFLPLLKNEITLALELYQDFYQKIYTFENDIFDQWLSNAIEIEGNHVDNPLLFFQEDKLVSTFSKDLFSVMDTALQLHHLDYNLPEVIMNVILRRNQILYNVMKVDELVNIYNEIINKMDPPIVLAMHRHFSKIKYSLRPVQQKRYTYLSIQLPKFVNDTMRGFQVFNVIYNEIKSYEKSISEKLVMIENLNVMLIDYKRYNGPIQDFLKTFNKFKKNMDINVKVITNAMSYIAEALNLIERKCFDIKTGYREQMNLFYEKYEKALSEALVKMTVNNFKRLSDTLRSDRAIFVIHGRLIEGKFTIASDIRNVSIVLIETVNYFLDVLKSIPRWLKYTNVRCPLVQNVVTFETYLPSTFHDLVANCWEVSNVIRECFDSIEIVNGRLENTAQKLAKFEFLFIAEAKPISNFAATNPTLNDYKEKLKSFTILLNSFENHSYLDAGCLRLDFSEYNVKLIERCKFWYLVYGKQLITECEKMIIIFSNKATTLKELLKTHFRDIHGLVVVEKCIKEIKENIFYADTVIHGIHIRFNFMIKHKITIPKELLKKFNTLKVNWQELYDEALSKSFCFEDAKKGLI